MKSRTRDAPMLPTVWQTCALRPSILWRWSKKWRVSMRDFVTTASNIPFSWSPSCAYSRCSTMKASDRRWSGNTEWLGKNLTAWRGRWQQETLVWRRSPFWNTSSQHREQHTHWLPHLCHHRMWNHRNTNTGKSGRQSHSIWTHGLPQISRSR